MIKYISTLREIDDKISVLFDNQQIHDEFIWRFFLNSYDQYNYSSKLEIGFAKEKVNNFELISCSYNSSKFKFVLLEHSGQHIGYDADLIQVLEFINEQTKQLVHQ